MEEVKEEVASHSADANQEEKPKKRTKKEKVDDDFDPSFPDEEDDFDIKDAASDYDSLPSDFSEEEFDDAFADIPDTPPKRQRKPKGEKQPKAKRSAPKSPPKKPSASVAPPPPINIDDDVIALSDSEDFPSATNHSSDNDDIVVGKSPKNRKAYHKVSALAKAPAISKNDEEIKTVNTAESICSNDTTPIKPTDIHPENEKKRSRTIEEDDEPSLSIIGEFAPPAAVEELPPTPKKPKLVEIPDSEEVVVISSPEAAGSSKKNPKAKKTAKASSTSKKASSSSSKSKSKDVVANKVSPMPKEEPKKEVPVPVVPVADAAPEPVKDSEAKSESSMDVDKAEVTVEPALKTETKIQKSTPIAPKKPFASPKKASSVKTTSSSIPVKPLPKPLLSKATAATKKSTLPSAVPAASTTTSLHKKVATSPVNAPFKPVGTSSGAKSVSGLPTQGRPLLRMGLSRPSKPLHPVK